MRTKIQKGMALALLSGALPGVAFAAPAPAAAPLSRGAFASELVTAAGLGSSNLSSAQAAKILVSQGIMNGYPDGSLHLSQPVTSYEAAVMVGRALGYPGGVAPAAGSGSSAWGANRVAWLEHEGLLQSGNLGGNESAAAAQGLLNQAFGTSAQALTLMQSTQHTTPVPMTMAGTVSGAFTITPPANIPLPPGAPSTLTFHADATMTGRINSQGDMQMNMTEVVSAPGMPGAPTGVTTLQLTEYVVNHTLYMEETLPPQAVQPGQSATTWAQMSMPSTTLMAQRMLPISTAFLKDAHLRVITTGTSTSTVAFSVALTSPQSVMALLPGMGNASGVIQSAIGSAFQVLKAVYVHGQAGVNSQEQLAPNVTIVAEVVSHRHVPANMPTISGTLTEQVTSAPAANTPIQLPTAAAGAVQMPALPFLSGGSSSSSSATGG